MHEGLVPGLWSQTQALLITVSQQGYAAGLAGCLTTQKSFTSNASQSETVPALQYGSPVQIGMSMGNNRRGLQESWRERWVGKQMFWPQNCCMALISSPLIAITGFSSTCCSKRNVPGRDGGKKKKGDRDRRESQTGQWMGENSQYWHPMTRGRANILPIIQHQ